MLCDYHVHSMFSDDAFVPPETVVQEAFKLNLDEICFCDHVDYGIKPDWDQALTARVFKGARVLNVDYDAYFPTIEHLRDEYAGRIGVKCGLEFGVQTHTIDQFNRLWDRWGERLDFTLLSIHQVDDLESWTGDFQKGRTREAYNHDYYEELLKVATSFEHWSVLAHLDLIKRYDPHGPLDFPANRDLVAATLEHTIKCGKGIELNTSSIRYGLKDSQPAREILELYRDLGGTIVTLGSDAHTTAYIGAYLRHFQHYLEDLGFAGFHTFEKMVPTFVPFR